MDRVRNETSGRVKNEGHSPVLFLGERYALLGGALATAIVVGGHALIGLIYSEYEALRLLRASVGSMQEVGGSVVTASATILALMLTLLSIGGENKKKLDREFFLRIKRIGLMSAISLCGSLLMLLLISIPIPEKGALEVVNYQMVYYFFIGILASIVGTLVASVLMLLSTIYDLVTLVRPEVDYE